MMDNKAVQVRQWGHKAQNNVHGTKDNNKVIIPYVYQDFDDVGYYIGNTGKLLISPTAKIRNVYPLIYSTENLILSQYTAQKGKKDRTEIDEFNENINENLQILYEILSEKTYVPGEYKVKEIHDPKDRIIMIAPFFPDRIIHHCVINVLSPFWTHIFIANTYACIKGRGIQKCADDVGKALMLDFAGTQFCLKTDITKYYDHIDHAVLKAILRYTIDDEDLLELLFKIIDSNGKNVGLPIGNFTSQYLANIYLAYFDHWVKEELARMVKQKFGCKIYYFRYMDDMVFLAETKEALQFVLDMAGLYLGAELHVEFKHTWQIFPVDDRSIDFVGFKQNHYNILLRKTILLKFYKKLEETQKHYLIKNEEDIKHLFPSEYGWIIKCSEQHKNFIFNKCINYGNIKTENRADICR